MSQQLELTVSPAPGRSDRYLAVARNPNGEVFRDVMDLNSAHSRRRFIKGVMNASSRTTPNIEQPETIEAEVESQLLRFAAAPPGPLPRQMEQTESASADPRAGELAKTPQDVLAEAVALLERSDILDRVAVDIESLGVVGERENAMLIYLIGTSSQLPRPLAAIVKGPSSSGKSYIVQQVAAMFPPEVALVATSLTTNALYYFEKGMLSHRFVIAGERSRVEDDEQAEATRALREMIEAGRLSKAVALKDGDRIQTELLLQEGPISYIETTTCSRVFEEDANRCLIMSTDEQETQTRRILQATGAAAAGKHLRDADRIRTVHHAIQRMIPRVDVVVPFAEAVSDLYESSRVEARRELRHLLQVVKSIALLRFRQRGRNAQGQIEARIADYSDAVRLASRSFQNLATGISDGARRLLEKLQGAFGAREFTTREAHGVAFGSRAPVYGWLKELDQAGALEQTRASSGRVPASWRLCEPVRDTGCLPDPHQVLERHLQQGGIPDYSIAPLRPDASFSNQDA